MTSNRTIRALIGVLILLMLASGAGGCGAGGGMAAEAMAPPPGEAYGAAAPAPQFEPPGGAAMAVTADSAAREEAKPADKKKDEVKTWKRSQLVPNTSRLMIGDREELPLRGMQVKVTVDGFRARVVIDAHFMNDRDSNYEGTFQLRLPDEASPFFFAFGQAAVAIAADEARPVFFSPEEARRMGTAPTQLMAERASTWSGPKEARMVPNEKAALAYTETVRRAVDPALMEWSGAGVFSARVFPITARKKHRIVIGYDMDLLRAGDDLEYRFDLPANTPSTVIDINAASPQGAAIKAEPAAAPIQQAGRSFYRFEDPKDKSVVLRFKQPKGVWLSGDDPKTGQYFATALTPDLGAADAAGPGSPTAVFLVDTSLSANPDKFSVYLRLMKSILDKNRGSLKKFAVLFFNVESSWWKEGMTDNTPENAAALLSYANTLSLEGATDLGAALAEAAKPTWAGAGAGAATERWDLFLMSDGAATWGESDLYAMSKSLGEGGTRALFGYQTGLAGTDVGALGHLARESGGAVFSVVGEAEIDKAAVAHRSRPWRIAEVKVEGTSDILLAGRPKAVFPGQTLLLAGRGAPPKGASVQLTVERDGAKKTLSSALGPAVPSDLTPRVYGQIAVRQLEDLDTATEDYSKAYATHFRVTGKTCSLLMLESEADYLRFNIKPDDDALVIKSKPAGAVVQSTLASISGSLGDPKASFMSWLKKMEKMPGVMLEVPVSLRAVLETLPSSSFRVDVPSLRAKSRDRAGVPKDVQTLLQTHKMDYDVLTNDALRRLKAQGPADALKAISSLVEEQPGDGVLARDVGFSAMEWGLSAQAYHLFRRVAVSRPYEPQTYRAMARALIAMNKIDLAMAYFEVGLLGKWNPRFGEFKKILGLDYLHLLRRIERGEVKTGIVDYARARLSSVSGEISLGKADLVVMITWNTDNTDVDLHVIEPTGEECYYGHRVTQLGGQLTQDVTQGYGPEMYTLPSAKAGTYQVKAHYFASDRNRASARTKVYATIFEGWGTGKEKVSEKAVTLELGKQVHDIAAIRKGADAKVAAP
jgi:hypothetical protein